VGWIEIQAPVSVLRVVLWAAKGDIGVVRERRSAAALAFLETWAAFLPSRMAFWWSSIVRRVPSMREPVSKTVNTLEVVRLPVADSIGLGTLTPADLTGRERRVQRSGGVDTEVSREEGRTDGSFYRREVISDIRHYTI